MKLITKNTTKALTLSFALLMPFTAIASPATSTLQKQTKIQSTVNAHSSFEEQVLQLVNKERVSRGLSVLKMDPAVQKVARLKSQDMQQKHYFNHTSPTYGSPFNMLKLFGIKYSSAGENIAMGYPSPEAVVEGWMNSPGHRANILKPSYTHMGIGYHAKGNYWTQLFISK